MQDKSNHWPLLKDYQKLPEEFYTRTSASPVDSPELILWNNDLAKDLHLTKTTETLELLSGNETALNSSPIAQAYCGHQFGHFNILGDGRALLLGEIEANNQLYDIQLKGSGPTKYSRRGDGRATLYSMLREYLISEAMHSLGIPSSRSLAVISSNTPVFREERNKAGVLTRVSSSHIRVGTFELAVRLGKSHVKALCNYTINRHYPELKGTENPPLELLKTVIQKQIELVVKWISVGFIHGVMNTDNTSIAGETFDYGPCAFMNAYHPKTVFSSIDTQGRYAYENQKPIIKWNLMRFAETLIPLIHDNSQIAIDLCTEVFNEFESSFTKEYNKVFLQKICITNAEEGDIELLHELLKWMQDHLADFTNTFRGLTDPELYENELYQRSSFIAWKQKWDNRTSSISDKTEVMGKVNPSIIPRNHIVEEALLNASEKGDYQLFNDLLSQLKDPFSNEKENRFKTPPSSEEGYQTFCGT